VREDGEVLLLLPPSEAKAPGGDGPSLAELAGTRDTGTGTGTGTDAALHAARVRVLRAVAALCRRTPTKARVALRLPPGSAAADLAANISALDSATMPALVRFTGVLFAALDIPSLTAAERRWALRSTLVFSGAFGALTGDEPVPLHRVPGSATVPRLGGLTAYWKKLLAPALEPRLLAEELVVDLRSSDYAAMWQPAPEHAERVVTVRVLEDRDGRLQSVSWSAKHGKGLLARELLRNHSAPLATIDDVAAAAARIGYAVRPRAAVTGAPGVRGPLGSGLDLIVPH
jgi:cytoplasmic iron level regulating protein YaaA (DUF328/UPF0246 family)